MSSPSPSTVLPVAVRLAQAHDTEPDPAIEQCCRLATVGTNSPMAAISLQGAACPVILAATGLSDQITEGLSPLCSPAPEPGQLRELTAGDDDEPFRRANNANHASPLRHYAGVAIVLDETVIGTLSVFDVIDKRLSEKQSALLHQISDIVAALLRQRTLRDDLLSHESRLHDLARCRAECFWETSSELLLTWCSVPAEHVDLADWPQAVGQPLPVAVVCDECGDPVMPAQSLQERLREPHALSATIIRLHTDAGPRWLSVAARPVLDADGACQAVRGSVHAVTEQIMQRRTDRDRAQLMAQMALQLPGFPFELEVHDLDKANLIFAGDGLTPVTGFSSAELKRDIRGFLDRIHQDDVRAVVRNLHNCATRMTTWRQAFRLNLPDGQTRVLLAFAKPEQRGRQVVGWHGFITDVTERNRLEREKMLAEHASNTKSAFLARLNQQLRGPLNSVLGFAPLMAIDQIHPLATAQHQRLSHLESAGRRMLDLIDNMLNLSRHEKTIHQLDRRAVDVHAVVTACLGQAETSAEDRGVRLHVSCAPGPAMALADRHALGQIINQLVANAVHCSNAGQSVFVAIQSIGGRWCVSVLDRGRGYSAEQLATLLQPPPDTAQTRSAGFDPSLLQALAQAMGANITVRSVPDRGACFRLHLDKATGASPPKAIPVTRPIALRAAPASPGARPWQILLAEDDRLNAVLIIDALQSKLRCQVQHAEDGEQAWTSLLQAKPDLLLIDINMPGLNGYELIARIRAHPTLADLPCVAITAEASPEQSHADMQAGFDAYWPKPIDFSTLSAQIADMLERTPQTTEVAELATTDLAADGPP